MQHTRPSGDGRKTMKRKHRRLKSRILMGITCAEMLILLLAASAMDSPDRTIPIIAIAQALIWIGLFVWANKRGGKNGKNALKQ